MSNDQKPARIKIVNGGTPANVRGNAAKTPAPTPEPAVSSTPPASQTNRLVLLGAVVFLLGCAIGGVTLAAWPHVGMG
ncbi:hypothetical protein [Blastomonas aquatica]|uniref:Uncharacterized protein n=1 Tax=Blastomonas aquatica TaxID=1510276 RepID=A0ABQ1JTK8_9SPHN|nr:hypothetical protein [Blastomonas aquatica]GGB74467.1 hypothetical protein GCM10010833_32110 [Blastomonas aquatica]